MPYANNDGVEIHYSLEGDGPPLMLAHGVSLSGEDWRECGYVRQLKEQYLLIIVDGRGHGKSDKPHDPKAYSAAERVKDHVAVLNDLGISKANFWGFSAGGVIGFCAAKYAHDRFSSVIIGGLDPYPDEYDIGDRTPATHKPMQGLPAVPDPYRILFGEGGGAWLRFVESNMKVPPGMKKRLLSNDYQALIAQWVQPYPWRDEVLPLMDRFPFPCLLYVGDAEEGYAGMKYCSTEMPQAKFISFPDSHHLDIWVDLKGIIPEVKRFLEKHSG